LPRSRTASPLWADPLAGRRWFRRWFTLEPDWLCSCEAILDANIKVDRRLCVDAMAMGAEVDREMAKTGALRRGTVIALYGNKLVGVYRPPA
jgi:hypothetical protein